jgi:hypothetical protein
LPAGRFVYWPDRKPADLISGNSRYVAYLDSLPFQEGTPLTRTEEYSPTEVASSDSSLGNPDRQVFMVAGDTPGPSGSAEDRYLEGISADELSAEAPVDETDANRDALRECNRKRNEWRRRLRVLTVYFGAPSMFITLWFGFDYGTNPPLGTLII